MSEIQEIQSAIAISLRRRELEAALRGEDPVAHGQVSPNQLVIMRSLCSEMHAVLDDIADEALPMRFGRMMGELYMKLDDKHSV